MTNFIGTILAIIIVVLLSTLFFWGLGSLVVWVFRINYVWSIWHGFAVTLIISVLQTIFK